MRSRAPTVLAVLSLALVAALAVPGQAGAHALLVAAEPADGSHLKSSPQEIRLTFSEEISAEFRSIQLVAPNGRAVTGARVTGAGSTVQVDVPRLRRGTYAVLWRVVAEDDGHTTSGTIAFGVGVAPAAHGAAAREVKPAAVEVGLRWLRFSGLALLVGCMAVAGVVLPPARGGPGAGARRRVLDGASIGAGLAAIAGVASLMREVWMLSSPAGVGGPGFALVRDLLLSSRWGHLWLLEEAAVVILLMVSLRWRRRGVVTPALGTVACAGVAAVAVCEALGSHSASDSGAAVAADAAHLLSAALWLGAVAGLALAVWPAGTIGRTEARSLAVACRWRFGLVAGAGAAVAAVTGLYSAGREVASIDALLTTFYGRALLAKTGFVVLAAGLGAANAVLLTMLARKRRRSVVAPLIAAELIIGAGAFLGAGVLTASSPARGPQFAAPRPVRAPTLAANIEDVLVTATVRPNRPGENVLAVGAVSSRRPPPAPIEAVQARLGSDTEPTTLMRIEPGRYIGTVTLARAGQAGMSVVVHRAGRSLTSRLRWAVDAPDPARAVVVSSRRLDSIVDPLALALVAALAVVGAFALLRARLSAPSLPQYREEPS